MRDGINSYDKVILICSENSLNRKGVINEIEETLSREAREGGNQILFPIRIDNFVFTGWAPSHPGLATAIKDRLIADFTETNNPREKFNREINRLMKSLIKNN